MRLVRDGASLVCGSLTALLLDALSRHARLLLFRRTRARGLLALLEKCAVDNPLGTFARALVALVRRRGLHDVALLPRVRDVFPFALSRDATRRVAVRPGLSQRPSRGAPQPRASRRARLFRRVCFRHASARFRTRRPRFLRVRFFLDARRRVLASRPCRARPSRCPRRQLRRGGAWASPLQLDGDGLQPRLVGGEFRRRRAGLLPLAEECQRSLLFNGIAWR